MPPTGKLPTGARPFKEVVADMRHVVFSVVRDRPNPLGGTKSFCLGTGFFVAKDVFATCHHVINGVNDPHVAGDSYRLIANLTGSSATVHTLTTPQVGNELVFFPDIDLAVIKIDAGPDQPFVHISYDDVQVGEDVGVVGYPLASLKTDSKGNLLLEGLVYRAAKGAVTARYEGTLLKGKNYPVVEVNFMFVSGNSGGPVFEVETGKVIGMVQGIQWIRIAEEINQTALKGTLPFGVSPVYIGPIYAIYSWGIKLDCLRTALEGCGVVP